MAFEYGCFISYRHLDGIENFVRRLARDIKRDLATNGIPQLEVFWDEERIQPGNNFNALIPESLCKSIVMIVVYVPAYFNDQKPYCTKEFVAFLEHEERRLNEAVVKYPGFVRSTAHQIIPIILRKNPTITIPNEIGNRDYIDWSHTTAFDFPGRFANTNDYVQKKRSICDQIIQLWSMLSELDVLTDCQQYSQLPDEQHPTFQRLVQTQVPKFPL